MNAKGLVLGSLLVLSLLPALPGAAASPVCTPTNLPAGACAEETLTWSFQCIDPWGIVCTGDYPSLSGGVSFWGICPLTPARDRCQPA